MISVFNEFKSEILLAFGETLMMLIVSLTLSVILGIIIGYILYVTNKDGIYENKYIYNIVSTLINIIRSIPFILFIIVLIPFNRFLIGTGFGVYASMIPLSIVGTAIFSRHTEQSFLDLNKEIYETSYMMGSNSIQFFYYFLLKESRSSLILKITSTIISLLAYTAVMGIIGGGGLGYLAMSEGYLNFNYKLMWIIIIIMIILVQIIQVSGNLLAKYLDRK